MTVFTHHTVQTVRSVVLIVIFALGVFAILRSRIKRKRLCCILLVVLLFAADIILPLVPFEEPFLTFSTAEAAFRYKADDDMIHTIEGNQSTMIVSKSKAGTNRFTILSKNDEGWKPEIQSDRRTEATHFLQGTVVHLFRYKDTQDFYLAIHSVSGMIELFDNRDTEFVNRKGSFQGKNIPAGNYYAFLDGVDENYVLTIDGQEITFSNIK